MIRYIKYNINALEDIKMGSQGSQKDNEYALSYIAGSAIRGAYIGKYIRENNVNIDISKDEKLRRKLLTGIKFLNAYPLKDGRRALPFPCCFYADKTAIKEYQLNRKEMKLVNELDTDYISDDYKRVTADEFCILTEEEIRGVSVEKKFNLHVTTRQENGNLFRYEAIKKGQVFQGIVAMETDSEEELQECKRTLENAVMYLGGSKGSGYGRCLINNVSIVNENPETDIEIKEDNFDDELYIYVISDTISINKYGQIIGYIDEELLKNKLEIESIKLVKSSMQTQLISGYNSQWGCRPPQIMGIKAGSVFKYKYKGNLKNKNIEKLQDIGIGNRLEEGYGRILVLDNMGFLKLRRCSEDNENIAVQGLNKNSQKQLQIIINNIYRNSLEKEMDKKILENSKNFIKKISRNQIGKLIETSINARVKKSQNGKKYFIDYLEHIKSKEGNQKVYNQFRDTKIQNKELYDFMIDFINDSDNIEGFINSYSVDRKKIKIGEIEPGIDKEYVFNFNMIFIEKLFRHILRKEGDE